MRSLGLFGKPKVRFGNSLHERNCWSPPQLDRNLFAQINNAAVRFEYLIVTMFEAASHAEATVPLCATQIGRFTMRPRI